MQIKLKNILVNILETPLLRNMFLLCLMIVIIFPIFNLYYVYPSFTQHLIYNMENEANRAAAHMSVTIFQKNDSLSQDSMSTELKARLRIMQDSFQLEKIQIFSASGETIYSTNLKDIGKLNRYAYFFEIVAKGNISSKVVKKGASTSEDRVVLSDVIEIYVPIMKNGKFMGAFELYYDITKRKESLDYLVSRSLFGLYTVALILFMAAVVVIYRASIVLIKNKMAEKMILFEKEQAERANHAKTEFVDYVAHEIRNPLGGIMSYAQMGIKKIEIDKNEKILRYLNQILKSGNRLLNILNDLLDLSKLDARKMRFTFRKTDILKVVEEAVDEFEASIKDKGMSLSIIKPEVSSLIEIDSFRIGQVVRNLFSNALKFTPKGKQIKVTLEESEIQQEHSTILALKISVIDQGLGIPEGEIKFIFDKFAQSTKTKSSSGTGIGLQISEKIILAHQGRIWADNNAEGGATFSFVLPYEQKKQGDKILDKDI